MMLPRVGEAGGWNHVDAGSGAGPAARDEGGVSVTDRGEAARQVGALRERISKLSAASVRISASLDLETVLREIADSARSLTGARLSMIVTIGEGGMARDFVTSGLTEEEHRRLTAWPGGPRLFEHLRDLPDAVRISDGPAYLASLGLPPDFVPAGSFQGGFQGTPLRHRGRHIGNFYLLQKEGSGDFTSEDEEILVLFAAQAATAIANARTHRAEQRARADLEALIETSPVGVVVLDARTGDLISANREAERIAEGLGTPAQPFEALHRVITVRRADGRPVPLAKLPLAVELKNARTLRAEEIVLSVPDGRSVATLTNVTPIRSGDGTVESVVVTMQDLAPLEELERLRTEFLGMVGHELRTPIASIKGSAATLLEASPPLDPAEMREFHRIILAQADQMRGLVSDLLDAGRIDTGTLSVAPEPTELAALIDRARATFLSGGSGHPILIDLPAGLPRVMADRRRIVQVLNNLFSNAARHAPESSPIRVAAVHDAVHLRVSVSDEGRGVAPERLPHLFRKYSGVVAGGRAAGAAGSGLGLSISKGLVEAHGGRIWAESPGVGRGTSVRFTIPVAEARTEVPGSAARTGAGRSAAGALAHAARVLVVDDDPQTLRYVRDVLTRSGYGTLVTGDPRELPVIIRTERPNLVLLDLLLPGTDGIELMERVPELADLPVIFISAYERDETIARAFDAGAADYIVKPFSATELVARVRAALRRHADPEIFVSGELAIDYDRRRVTLGGRRLELTATEYELLRVLSLDAGRVSTYDTLMRRVWGRRKNPNPKLVRAFVKRLRQRLGDDASSPTYIFNERGVGYRMAAPGGE